MTDARITDPPAGNAFVRFAPGFGQRFILTVDTEEEFDWTRPLERTGHSVASVPRLRKFQQFCEGHGVVPLYLIDYPVAMSPLAAEILGEPVAAGRAEVGVQLHPWVSPPFDEEVSEYNSFAGNLPAELERAKFMGLRNAIERNFGAAPLTYRAGRYGVGSHTAALLRDGGITIDTSVRARFNYAAGGGPDFNALPVRPWWIDAERRLMEMPLTTVFSGPFGRIGPWLYPRLWRVPQMRGALARLGLLDRIPLTPEGVTRDEALRGIDCAVAEDLPLLVFSFHSPSLQPGHTPYVRSEDDLDRFYDWWRAVFARLAQRGVKPASVAEVMDAASSRG